MCFIKEKNARHLSHLSMTKIFALKCLSLFFFCTNWVRKHASRPTFGLLCIPCRSVSFTFFFLFNLCKSCPTFFCLFQHQNLRLFSIFTEKSNRRDNKLLWSHAKKELFLLVCIAVNTKDAPFPVVLFISFFSCCRCSKHTISLRRLFLLWCIAETSDARNTAGWPDSFWMDDKTLHVLVEVGHHACRCLPGTTNHCCFWPQHCSRIVPPSPSKWRLDLPMISKGFKWGCVKAILSSFISGVELSTTNKQKTKPTRPSKRWDSEICLFHAPEATWFLRVLSSLSSSSMELLAYGLMSSSPPSMRSNTEARNSRTLHFYNRQYLKSSVKLLSASIQVDWFSLPMERFLDRMPQLRQGLVKGVFLTKASSPWIGDKSQSIQVSLCLPNQKDLDTWYEAVFALPIAWPDITDIDSHYLKKTSAHQLLSIRMQMGVSHMWEGLSSQWHLLKHHLWNLEPSYLAGRLEELLILNRPCRPGEDVHDSVLPTSHWQAWKMWENTKKR